VSTRRSSFVDHVATNVHVLRANSASDELRDLWDHAISGSRITAAAGALHHDPPRRGRRVIAHVRGNECALWTISDEKRVLGFALVRDEVVEGVFVHHEQRRQRVATTLLRALVAGRTHRRTAWPCRGSRYEVALRVLGWKPSPYDARRVGGRRVAGRRMILVGGGAAVPSYRAVSRTRNCARVVDGHRLARLIIRNAEGLDVATNRGVDGQLNDLFPECRIRFSAQGLRSDATTFAAISASPASTCRVGERPASVLLSRSSTQSPLRAWRSTAFASAPTSRSARPEALSTERELLRPKKRSWPK